MNQKLTMPLLLLALASALPAFAQVEAVVNPASPVVGQPFTIEVPVLCQPATPEVTRRGFAIFVRFPVAACDEPLREQIATIPLGPLAAAGDYTVSVHYWRETDEPYAVERVRVRNNELETPFVVEPSAVPTNTAAPLPVRIRIDPFLRDFCDGRCKVIVGGAEVPSTIDDELITFTAPSRAAGPADVTLVGSAGGSLTARQALYFFDRTAPAVPAQMERILFPILFNAPGAHGSLWRTEVVISNPERWPVETYNDISPIACLQPPCGERLAPQSRLAFTGGGYPRGVALVVGRRDADRLAFSLRVRDVSREAEGFGTEIPVVRERDMFDRGVVTLLDVPVDPRYRVKLRIYSFDETALQGTLVAHDYVRDVRTRTPFVLQRACFGPRQCSVTPAYAELDLPAVGIDARVNLYVEMPAGSLAWAFASVTNNATQQVTVVTPDGEGGVPCTECGPQ